jgi:hypothetical protein
MSNLSQAIKEAYTIASAKRVIVKTLSILGLNTRDLHIVKGVRDFEAVLDNVITVFSAVPFDFAPPLQSDEGASSITIKIDILSKSVVDFFKEVIETRNTIRIVYREWTSETGEWISGVPLQLYLNSLIMNDTSVALKAGFMDIVNKKFPSQLYTTNRFFSLKY